MVTSDALTEAALVLAGRGSGGQPQRAGGLRKSQVMGGQGEGGALEAAVCVTRCTASECGERRWRADCGEEGVPSDAHRVAPSGLGYNRERTVGMRKLGTQRAGPCRH